MSAGTTVGRVQLWRSGLKIVTYLGLADLRPSAAGHRQRDAAFRFPQTGHRVLRWQDLYLTCMCDVQSAATYRGMMTKDVTYNQISGSLGSGLVLVS